MPNKYEEHDTSCDCGDCCESCGFVPAKGWLNLSDNGLCEDCEFKRAELAADMLYDQMRGY